MLFFKNCLFSYICILPLLLLFLLIEECHSQIYYHPGTGMYHNYGPSAQHHYNYGYSNPYHYYQGQQPYQYYQPQVAAGHTPYHYSSGHHSAAAHVNPTNIAYHHDEGNHGHGVPGLATFWLSCSSHNCQGRKK